MTPRRKRLREEVFKRDHGVCSECHLDTESLKGKFCGAELLDEFHCHYVCLRCDASFVESSASCPSCGGTQLRRKPAVDARREVEQELVMLGWSVGAIIDLRRSGARGTAFWHADHILSLEEHGKDTLENLQTLCRPHHDLKSDGQSYRRRVTNKTSKRKALRAEREGEDA